jgi:hypothetical protein
MITYFGLLSPCGVEGSSDFVSKRGDGELGRSLSPEKSALSRSGRFRPPLPRARRAHERSEQGTTVTVLAVPQWETNILKTSVVMDVTLCNVADHRHHFAETCYLHLKSQTGNKTTQHHIPEESNLWPPTTVRVSNIIHQLSEP